MDVLVRVERRDDDDGGGFLDIGPREQSRGLDAVQVRHADVQQAHVRAQLARECDGLPSVGGLTDDLDVGLAGQDRGEPNADDALVIGDEHADRHVTLLGRGSTAWTHHPRSGPGPACSVPPSTVTRSVMPTNP